MVDYTSFAQQMREMAGSDPSSIPLDKRMELLAAVSDLKEVLEIPPIKTARLVFAGQDSTLLRIASDMGMFDALADRDGQFTVAEIAKELDAHPLLVKRILRFLHRSHICREQGVDTFVGSPILKDYRKGSVIWGVITHITSQMKVLAALPDYYKETKYKLTDDVRDGPFQYWLGKSDTFFEWIKGIPEENQAFQLAMSFGARDIGEPWFVRFPFQEKFANVSDNKPVLVDVGGGDGHDLVNLKNAYPEFKGRVVLQDLPDVIKRSEHLQPDIQVQAVDFFKPQQVVGARAYFLRSVIHDWPDKQAKEILGHVREAMDGESSLLLLETVTPDEGVSEVNCNSDMVMHILMNSLERTKGQYTELLGGCGFELVKAWLPDIMDGPLAQTLFEFKKAT